MDGIKVVAALVRCAADLLLCDDIHTDHLRFVYAEECRNALPAIIREYQRSSASDQVIMGRCRFQVERASTATRRLRQGTGIDVAGAGASIAPSAP